MTAREEFLPVVFERGREVGIRELVDVRSTYAAALEEAEERAARFRRSDPTARAAVLTRTVSAWAPIEDQQEVDDGS